MAKIEARSLQAALAAAAAALTDYLGALAVPFAVLCGVMIVDYVTGMAAAWKNHTLSSKRGVAGIVKKLCYPALVFVGMGVDWLLVSGMVQLGWETDPGVFFGVLVAVWLVINELISILENLKQIGIPLPGFLVRAVKHLKISGDQDEDKEEKHE